MNLKKTVVLGALLAAGILYLKQVEMPHRELEAGQRMAFAKLKESEISSLGVTQRDGDEQRYELIRGESKTAALAAPEDTSIRAEHWAITGLAGAVVDAAQLKALLDGLSALNVEGPLEEGEMDTDLAVYGLDKPPLTIVVHEKGDRSTEVAFGKKNEYLSKRYVKISGRSGVFLIDDASFAVLNKSRSDIRSKTPFGFSTADVREVRLASSQGGVRIVQSVVGEWKIVEPKELPGSTQAVSELLRAIQGVSVSEFIDGAHAKRGEYGFGMPRVRIGITFRDGIEPKDVEYQLANKNAQSGDPEELYWVSSQSDTIFKLQSDPSKSLVKTADDLRERRIVKLSTAEIERVVSSGEGITPVEVATKGVAWSVNGKDSDPEFTEQLLADIGALQADEFPASVPESAFSKPFVVLTITKSNPEKQVVTVTVGAETTGKNGEPMRFVRTSDSDTVYLIRDVEAKRIVPHEEVLLPRTTPTPEPTSRS